MSAAIAAAAARDRPGLTPKRLRQLFEPRSVALLGASDRNSWSALTHSAITEGGFPGAIHYVNPRSPTAHGRPTVPRLADIGTEVDLAFVMVPREAVLDVLEEAADAGVRNAVVLSAGFGEAGPAGRQAEAALAALAAQRDLAIVGPNTLGFMNLPRKTVLFPGGAPPTLKPGAIALVSHSGALGNILVNYCAVQNIGVSLLVATGNEAGVTLTEVVDYLVEDEATRAIGLFCESFRRPDDLMRVAERARRAGKPIVALKVGRNEISARAAEAHTGAIVGDDRVVDAVLRQSGIIRVDSLEQLATTAALLVQTGPLRGRGLTVGAISGGACDVIADRCESEGIELRELGPETSLRLGELLPTFGTAHNPVDVTGAAVSDPLLFGRILEVLAADPSCDVLLCQHSIPTADGHPVLVESIGHVAEALRTAPVPGFLTVTTGQGLTGGEERTRDEQGIPFVGGGLDLVLFALGRAMWWSEWQREAVRRDDPSGPAAAALPPAEERNGTMPGPASRELLRANGVPIRAEAPAAPAGAAARAAEAIASPMGAVGVELRVGILRDPQWGQVLAVGPGGARADPLADAALRVLPVAAGDVRGMLSELPGAAMLLDAPGTLPTDVEALVTTILAVASLAQACGDTLEVLEVNPLCVEGSRVEALDALVTWTQLPERGDPT